jgi:tRNA nucleotidyltransferase/poly(A) polymerase
VVFKIQDTERKILEIVSQAATKMQVPAYVVGGYVRDRLLARASKDIDIVCVGSGIELAQQVAGELHPVPRITIFQRFGTAMIKHRDIELEFVGARKES